MLECDYQEVVKLLRTLHNAWSKTLPTIKQFAEIYNESSEKLKMLYDANTGPLQGMIGQIISDLYVLDTLLPEDLSAQWVEVIIKNLPSIQEIQEDLTLDAE